MNHGFICLFSFHHSLFVFSTFLKLLFPHALSSEEIDIRDLDDYCLQPAKKMRAIIRKQVHIMGCEYPAGVSEITCSPFFYVEGGTV
jgi:hypothetical protein